MSGKQLSYDYQNTVRDLSDAFQVVVQSNPILRVLLGSAVAPDGKPVIATNTKHEWLEDVVSPKTVTVNGTRSIGGATLTVVSTSGVAEGTIFGFKSALGASKTVQLIVTEVTNSTTLTVSVYGGTTDVQLVATDIGFLVGRPKNESTDPTADDGREPSVEYNYTQIFDRTAKVSLTAQNVKKYGIGNALSYQVQHQLIDLAYEIVASMIYGQRVQRSTSQPGSMGGLLYFLENASGNKVDCSTASISANLLNDAFELAWGNGATGIDTAICNVNQARKISALNTTGNNPIVTRDDRRAGSVVYEFISAIPVGDKGQVSRIVVEPQFPNDKIALVDLTKGGILPLENRQFQDKDATPAGADYAARRIIGEYTMEFKNAAQSHVLLHNMAL